MDLIAFYRVSTKKQDIGLDAQRTIVQAYATANNCQIIAEYAEKESGKAIKDLSIDQYLSHHTQLPIALKQCKDLGATLIVAKVDRLVRDYAIGGLLVKAYNIEFCDHPHMTPLEQGIFFSMAQQEREYISQRTKQAFAEKRKKGVKLGAHNEKWQANEKTSVWNDKMRTASLQVRRDKATANDCNRRAWTLIRNVRGLSWSALAHLLNDGGFTTARGGKWQAVQVQRLAKLFENNE